MKHLFYGLIGLISLAGAAQAADTQYERGTVGYLTQKCEEAIQLSEPSDFYSSECMKFIGIHIFGVFAAGMINHNLPSEKRFKVNDLSCQDEVNQERKRLKKETFCTNKEGHTLDNSPVAKAFNVANYGNWLRESAPEELKKPIFPHINNAFHDGPYCQNMLEWNAGDDSAGEFVKTYVNKDLTEAINNMPNDKSEQLESKTQPWVINSKAMRDQCMKNIAKADGDVSQFMKTDCSIAIQAHLSGLFITDVTEKNTITEGRCANDINRLHKHEILAKRGCFYKDLNLIEYTKHMYNQYEEVEGEEKLRVKSNNRNFCELQE